MLETEQRGLLYALYSRLFLKEADETLLETIEQEDIREFFPNLFEWEAYRKLPREDLIEKHLNVDFTEISLLHLIPYESFYVREDGMIESGGDNPVIQFYDDFNYIVEKDKARIVSPDHIGAELEFMHLLCDAQTKAFQNNDAAAARELETIQKSFLKNHVLRWMPLYLINVKNEAQTPLYHDGAMTGLEFILSDYEYLHASS
ncbi:MAG: dehydrogenase [Campylobacteraceae bacterium 4484_4]|nr:MAG: dehydrogenase [Campylobacteraceae bacterium 4484_4]